MNKKKLTLLIALSIFIAYTVAPFTVVAFGIFNEPKEEKTIVEKVSIKKPQEPKHIEVEKIEEIVEVVPLKSIEEVAKEVILGLWGNGEERKIRLIEAGYNYDEVQAKVAELMPKPQPAKKPAAAPSKLPTGNYPEAQLIWNTMISWGWAPETCAGIIGNMMAEVGQGNKEDPTSWLNLDWDSNGNSGYGLIQWTGGRRTAIKSRYGSYPNIEQQLIFMRDELFGTNNTNKQVSDAALDIIMNTNGNQTPESIAMSFATNYERCAARYRAKRQGYARIAYEYFMSK